MPATANSVLTKEGPTALQDLSDDNVREVGDFACQTDQALVDAGARLSEGPLRAVWDNQADDAYTAL